jgi:hypothetical protein
MSRWRSWAGGRDVGRGARGGVWVSGASPRRVGPPRRRSPARSAARGSEGSPGRAQRRGGAGPRARRCCAGHTPLREPLRQPLPPLPPRPPPAARRLRPDPPCRCRSAVAAGEAIYSHAPKRVLVVRFDLPRGGGPHVAKATRLADADPRAEALGALVCAEMRAYKLLQLDGRRHASVGELDAVAWAAAPGGPAEWEEQRPERAPWREGKQAGAQAKQQVTQDAAPAQAPPPLSPEAVDLQLGPGRDPAAAPASAAPAAAGAAEPGPGSNWVVLIQPYFGAETLDGYVCSRIAAAPRRHAPGSLALERLLLPLLEGVAEALRFVHAQVGDL